jgi:hypothetical protein
MSCMICVLYELCHGWIMWYKNHVMYGLYLVCLELCLIFQICTCIELWKLEIENYRSKWTKVQIKNLPPTTPQAPQHPIPPLPPPPTRSTQRYARLHQKSSTNRQYGRLIGRPNRFTGQFLLKIDGEIDLPTSRLPIAGSGNRSTAAEPTNLLVTRTD